MDTKYGGAGSSYFAAMLVVEELAKYDPSVSVLADVQNTLVLQTFKKFASEEMKDKFIPRLVKDTVRILAGLRCLLLSCYFCFSDGMFLPIRDWLGLGCLCHEN